MGGGLSDAGPMERIDPELAADGVSEWITINTAMPTAKLSVTACAYIWN